MLLGLQGPLVLLILVTALARQEGVHEYATRAQISSSEARFGTLKAHGELIQGSPGQRIRQLSEDESMTPVQPSLFASFSQVLRGKKNGATLFSDETAGELVARPGELWSVVGLVFVVAIGAYLYYASTGDKSVGAEDNMADSAQAASQNVEPRTPVRRPPSTKDLMAGYENFDGSWARAYRQADDQRRQAIELIVRLGIISTDEFANSQTFPKHIEERIKVALMLLEQKPLSQWEQIGEKAQGLEKESVLACFTTQGVPSASPHDFPSPLVPQGASPPPPVMRTLSTSSPSVAAPAAEASSPSPAVEPEPAILKPAAVEPSRLPPTAVLEESPSVKDLPPFAQPGQGTASAPAASFGHQSQRSGGAFVLPVGSPTQKSGTSTVPLSATVPVLGGSPADRPRQLPWPPTSYSRSMTPPPAGNTSQGWPVQIKFASNAISGSAWEKSAAASLTPPGSERFPKGRVTPPLTPPGTEKSPK